MTRRQWTRVDCVERVSRGELGMGDGGRLLGLSARQMRRLVLRYERDGVAGLAHGNTGRRPSNALPKELRERLVALGREEFAGFNDHHMAEMLAELHAITISRQSLQRILRKAGLPSPRKRRGRAYRQRRAPQSADGPDAAVGR